MTSPLLFSSQNCACLRDDLVELCSAIACAGTHPRARELVGACLHVAPIADVLARALEEFV